VKAAAKPAGACWTLLVLLIGAVVARGDDVRDTDGLICFPPAAQVEDWRRRDHRDAACK
jgi:hypothetical protein